MTNGEHTRRPALVKLTEDLETLRDELVSGFESRREILEWSQRLTVRTLGALPTRWFVEVGDQFRGVPSSGKERTLVACLLTDDKRTRDISHTDAREFRQRLYALTLRPAYHRAFRQLRADAGEYIDDDGTQSQHSGAKQRWIAMRPALDELDDYQKRTLGDLLDGFDKPSDILDWGSDLELATHGELPRELVARCYREGSTRQILLGDRPGSAAGRELFAAFHVVPSYNKGVQDLSGRAGESPDAVRQETTTKLA